MKDAVKRNMRVPQVTPPQVGAKRLQYVERRSDQGGRALQKIKF